MYDITGIDRLLIDRFVRGDGTVFVGAGVSLASRLPNWKKLMAPLRDDLGLEAAELDPLQIAELYEVKRGRTALVQHLREQLGSVKFRMNRTHELLVSLPVKRIYTTNFDDLLEQAAQKKQINRHVISNASQVGLSNSASLSIIKLHGDLSDPNSIVITARDFYSYASKNPAVADLLKVELQTRTVLFIGYSFSDPNLAMILANAAFQVGNTPPPIYAIQFNPTALTVSAMRARGITVIPISAEPGTTDADKKIEAWLYQFSRSLNSSERRNSWSNNGQKISTSRAPLIKLKYSVKSERISERIRNGLSSEFRVIVVKGEAGIGKTHIVAEATKNFLQWSSRSLWAEGFEQIVWVLPILRENGGYHSLEQIFSSITSQVDGNLPAGDSETELLKERIEAVLQERRLLVVIEDLDDPRADYDRALDVTQHADEANRFDEIKDWLEAIGTLSYVRSRIVVTSRTATLAGFVIDVTRLENEDAGKMIREHARSLLLRRNFDSMDDVVESKIINLTMGNPQAIRLALGLINGTGRTDWLEPALRCQRKNGGKGIESVIDTITAKIWENLRDEENACRVMEAISAFPTEEWIPSALLKCAVDVDKQSFGYNAIKKCVQFGLLEFDSRNDSYFMHGTIKESLGRQGLTDRQRLNLARTQLVRHLIKVLSTEEVACRPEINEKYWNSLVRDEFVTIDRYWPIIESLMWWTEDRKIVVQFLLLLVHYMDSRFLNGQRIFFVRKVISEFYEMTPRIRALLKIDALGWTYIEEGLDHLALQQIEEGLKLLSAKKEDDDLRALAYAWKARIAAKQGKIAEARSCISDAEKFVKSWPEKYWIIARVCMSAGDVKLMEKDAIQAEKLYLQAEANEEKYGGEVGYQTDPRIGFALLRQADLDPDRARAAVNKARERFARLAENEDVLTGRLYGEYGLALISSRENSTEIALLQLKKILKELSARQGGNNVLVKLAKESYESLANGESGRLAQM